MAEAAKAQIMLSVEIMDTTFMSNISRWLDLGARYVARGSASIGRWQPKRVAKQCS